MWAGHYYKYFINKYKMVAWDVVIDPWCICSLEWMCSFLYFNLTIFLIESCFALSALWMLHRVTDTSVSSVISRTVQAFVEQVSGDPLCATGPLHAPGMLLDPEDPPGVEMSAKSLFSWGFQSRGRRGWHWTHSQITQLVITSSSTSGKERMDLCESVKSGNLLKTRNLKGLPWGGDLFVGPKTED